MSATVSQDVSHEFVGENSKYGSGCSRTNVYKTARSLGWKTILDRIAAFFLLVPGFPLIAILIILVRLTSRGPGIYRQLRVGMSGRQFMMYKLRSMRIDAESGTGPVWSTLGADSRVTPLGYWLRKLHLDELPQLFNVLRGEMALVGPRPERPEFVSILAEKIPGYLDRLQTLPGITGLAQVNLPPDTDLDSVRRKLVLDREYILTSGFWLDQRILMCTFFRVLGLRGGRSVRLFALERTVTLTCETPSADSDQSNKVVSLHSVASATPSNDTDAVRKQSRAHAVKI